MEFFFIILSVLSIIDTTIATNNDGFNQPTPINSGIQNIFQLPELPNFNQLNPPGSLFHNLFRRPKLAGLNFLNLTESGLPNLFTTPTEPLRVTPMSFPVIAGIQNLFQIPDLLNINQIKPLQNIFQISRQQQNRGIGNILERKLRFLSMHVPFRMHRNSNINYVGYDEDESVNDEENGYDENDI